MDYLPNLKIETKHQTELEATHIPWAIRFKKAKVLYKAWGSAGPDFLLLNANGALIELKREDTASAVKTAYSQIIDRTNVDFSTALIPFFAVITPDRMLVWLNKDLKGFYAPVTSPDIVFVSGEESQFISFLKQSSPNAYLYLDDGDNIDSVLRSLYSSKCPDSVAALLVVLNMHKSCWTRTNDSFIFAPGEGENEKVISANKEVQTFIISELLNKYKVRDGKYVKKHLRHKWSQYQPDSKRAGLGKYYTPEHLVKFIKELVLPHLKASSKAIVADLAAGCGAFLGEFDDYQIMGRDIDAQAVMVLLEMGFSPATISLDNSLCNVTRSKLGLSDEELIIVGNPPYNDTGSMNKRFSTNKKDGRAIPRDSDLCNRDLGIAFLRAYAKLDPSVICVLHPLSYLIKPSNFKQLDSPMFDQKGFFGKYKLVGGGVFSSKEFGKNIIGSTQFPIIAALYERGTMTYKELRDFKFPIFGQINGGFGFTRVHLQLSNITTIDGVIRKYPPSSKMTKVSNIGLYQYNFRDTNSLLSSGALTDNYDYNKVPIQFNSVWQYAYLNVYKRHFKKNFILGNISPIIDSKLAYDLLRGKNSNGEDLNGGNLNGGNLDGEHSLFLDICLIDTIIKNQKLKAFNRNNKLSFIHSKFVINHFRRYMNEGKSKWYDIFINFMDTGETNAKDLEMMSNYFQVYFKSLTNSALLIDAGSSLAWMTTPVTKQMQLKVL